MTTLDKVKKVISDERKVLEQKYNISRVGIYGSVARGEDSPESDIDLLVDFTNPIGLFELVGLETYLSGKLGKKVEIATRKYLDPYIKNDILRDEQVIYD